MHPSYSLVTTRAA
ncbi:BgTH12-02074 [Blumeria graminis f. sp. triticale]|uniref:BgTH12-02074 n=1 Tax=Blumeria graminis f. sp. triticale TaxID=1689686 RepID=A0A9W4D010_BLUGR|nr:BgTH12-02074 [Blumeria graminis f. sp. triticale]